MPTVLVVEDDGLLAFELINIVEQFPDVRAVSASSVKEALAQLDTVSFALLDINVEDGTTYGLARKLRKRGIPFAFTSGANRSDLPDDLIDVPFVPKPSSVAAISAAVSDGLAYKRGKAASGL